MIAISLHIGYNMLNKGAGKIDKAYPFRRKSLQLQITVRLFSGKQDGYFLCLDTSVITAQSMITKVNRSLYVTMLPPLSVRSRNGWHDRPTGSPIKHIMFSMSSLAAMAAGFNCLQYVTSCTGATVCKGYSLYPSCLVAWYSV